LELFAGCTNLTNITVDASNSAYKHSDNRLMLLNKAGTTLIAYPSASGQVIVDASITAVGDGAFEGCTGLSSVSLPAAQTIGEWAFSGCTSLGSVSLPAAQTIGEWAFSGCTGLSSVSLPAAQTIGDQAFLSPGTGDLTVILGGPPPELGTAMFNMVPGSKTVTVKVPAGEAAWNGQTGTFEGAENTIGGPYWGEGFRGIGWDNSGAGAYPAVNPGMVFTNISLTVEAYTP
jgi:hypothetical protein